MVNGQLVNGQWSMVNGEKAECPIVIGYYLIRLV